MALLLVEEQSGIALGKVIKVLQTITRDGQLHLRERLTTCSRYG